MSGRAGVSATNIANIRGKVGQRKVKRYWPGKAPEWADEAQKDDEDIRMMTREAFSSFGGSDNARKDDARLHRLAERRVDNREQVRVDHRLIRQADIVSTIEEENTRLERMEFEDNDEDALEERRRRIREKTLQRQQEEEEKTELEEEEEKESEEETESEEKTTMIALVKPVFVLKSDRDTIDEREKCEVKERALEELLKKKLEERKLETKQIVFKKIREEEIIQKNLELEANSADVDTDDEVNEAEHYEAWKSRERARNKRARNEEKERDKEEIKRIRDITEVKRKEWERGNAPPPKQK